MKLCIWCDSGANAFSNREQIVEVEYLGVTEAEWGKLSDDEKDDLVKEVAWDRLDWGYTEL